MSAELKVLLTGFARAVAKGLSSAESWLNKQKLGTSLGLEIATHMAKNVSHWAESAKNKPAHPPTNRLSNCWTIMSGMNPTTFANLKKVSVATLCTQLFKRGFRNVYLQGPQRLTKPTNGNLVGPAFTMRNIPAREDIDQIAAFDNPDHPQRKGIETVPPGHVLVLDCRGEKRVASGGQILTTRLMVRGAAGLVSDGPVRDSGDISKMDFPVYCAGGSAPLNLIYHHAIDLNVPIGCGGVAVYPGDIIVGDDEGVVVIPTHLADEVAADAAAQEVQEVFLLERVAGGAKLPGTYPPNAETKAMFEAWKKEKGL